MARSKKAPRGAKSQAIRDYLTANKDAGTATVVAALKEQGLSVSTPTVSAIRAKMGLGKKRRRRKVARAAAAANGAGRLSVDDLLRAKKLVDEIGAERAREAIAALAKLA